MTPYLLSLDRAIAALPAKNRQSSLKSAPWKVAVAAHLKATTDVPNHWLAQQLDMGSPVYVSKHTGWLRRNTANTGSCFTFYLGTAADGYDPWT